MLASLDARAIGHYVSGNDLLEMLKNEYRRGQAYGYIEAIADAEDQEKVGLLFGIGLNRTFFCAPNDATLRQIVDVVQMSLEQHPADRHQSAAALVRSAFLKEWPCPR